MSDHITDRLDAITARADAATEGPWGSQSRFGVTIVPRVVAARHVRLPVKDRGTNSHDGETRHVLTTEFVGTDADAEFIATARTDVPALVAALRAVLELHRETSEPYDTGYCEGCNQAQEFPEYYPCPTVQAITTALGGRP